MGPTRALSAILLAYTWACPIASQIEAQEVPIPQLTPGPRANLPPNQVRLPSPRRRRRLL